MASCTGGAAGKENPRAESGPAWGRRQRNSAGFRMIVVHGWVTDPGATRSGKLCVRAALPVACSIGGQPRPRPPHPSLHRDVVAAMAANPRANGGARVPPPCVVAPVGPTRAGGGRYSPVESLVTASRPGYRHLPPAIFPLSGGPGPSPANRALRVRHRPGQAPPPPRFAPVRAPGPAFVTLAGAQPIAGAAARRVARYGRAVSSHPACRDGAWFPSRAAAEPSNAAGAGSHARRVQPAAPGGRNEKPEAKSPTVCCQSRRGWLVLAKILATLLWGRPAMP
jgi:hypothetical protein